MIQPRNISNLLKAPIAAAKNGTITFKIYDEPSLDPDTPTFTTKTITGTFQKQSQMDVTQPGMDKNSIFYRARLVDPLNMPPEIKSGDRGQADIAGVTGTFEIFLEPQNPHMGANGKNAIGDKFTGRIIRGFS